MCVLPLGHTASLRYTIKNAIVGAGKVYLYKNFWQIKDNFWKILNKNKINFIGVVPSMIKTIYYLYKKKNYKNFYLKFFGCGSSILSRSMQMNFKKKFNVNIRNIYGMSEIGVATMDNPDKDKIYGTIGKPLNGTRIELIHENNKFIKKNNVKGEILVRTPAIFSGYKSKDNLQKKNLFFKKFFKTGDLGIYNKKNIIFVDRSKDIIIKGGVNVSPQEIDNCLQQNKNVYLSATIGITDKFYGENIKSFVILKKGKKIIQKNLIRYCEKNIGKFRSPREIKFVSKLPQTISGKIIKRYL